jgi:hypothetical protein
VQAAPDGGVNALSGLQAHHPGNVPDGGGKNIGCSL